VGTCGVIKMLAPAIKHPRNRTLGEFHRYWAESHGPLFANTKRLRRYVQHLTLPEAYGNPHQPPTYDGCSMFWYDDLDAIRLPSTDPADVALWDAVMADDRQLFDREDDWPQHHKSAMIVAEEHVVVDGETTPEMVKIIGTLMRKPGLTPKQCYRYWLEVHGPLAARTPGLRRYVQNHAIQEAHSVRGMTHDGWSEAWFDDLDSLYEALDSPEWKALGADGADLFARPIGTGIARERVQKDFGDQPRRWAEGMSEGEIRDRLAAQGYRTLAADPSGPARIKAADEAHMLCVWTDEHIVTIDRSRIDARPEH
jgi:uncharacterized protein (TIGR02118 family)